jgi:hypothetical protein
MLTRFSGALILSASSWLAQRLELGLHHVRMQEPARAVKRARGRAARVG